MKKIFNAILLAFAVVLPSMSQTLQVSGVVTDSKTKETLPGVNVFIEGTTTGTITDINGKYNITVDDENAVLVFSFVGMQTVKEKVSGRTVINVAMSPATESLNEVMVVAYGVSTKEAYTGAADVVNKDVIEDRPVTSFQKALQGTTTGLQVTTSSGQPGAGSTVRIRGIGSLSASSAPLYVLDLYPPRKGLEEAPYGPAAELYQEKHPVRI